ncbi:MAG: DUF945 domain-containing protein [Tomitella sp.]|nr:DUF945 domain-containing protein [Tomitella sp.]
MTAPTISRPAHRLPAQQVLGTDIAGAGTVSEALHTASLDWGLNIVDADNLTIMGDSGVTTTSFPGRRLLMRDDTHTGLGMVGARYEPVDNAAAFALADDAHALGATFAHAGELDHGRGVFLTMDLPEARVQVGGHDLVDFGVIFRAGHGGSGGILGEVSGTRLVCTNGMTVGIGRPHQWKIRHTRSAQTQMDMARVVLQGAARYAKEFAAIGEQLISEPMGRGEFVAYLDRLYPEPDEDKKASHTRWQQRRADLLQLFATAGTQEEGRSTRWAAFNAVVEYEDWHRGVRATGGENADEARAARQFRPDTDSHKQQAFDLIRT